MLKTRITELFGIKHPVIQGGMQWVGFAGLVSAVSNAGVITSAAAGATTADINTMGVCTAAGKIFIF